MKKRYIVCINNSNSYWEKKFVNYLKKNSLGWWHWIDGVWLVTDYYGRLSSEIIRNDLMDIFPNIRIMVIQLNQNGTDTWHSAGTASPEENEKMFNWLHEFWKRY